MAVVVVGVCVCTRNTFLFQLPSVVQHYWDLVAISSEIQSFHNAQCVKEKTRFFSVL